MTIRTVKLTEFLNCCNPLNSQLKVQIKSDQKLMGSIFEFRRSALEKKML